MTTNPAAAHTISHRLRNRLRDDPSAEINLTIMRSAGVIAGAGAFR